MASQYQNQNNQNVRSDNKHHRDYLTYSSTQRNVDTQRQDAQYQQQPPQLEHTDPGGQQNYAGQTAPSPAAGVPDTQGNWQNQPNQPQGHPQQANDVVDQNTNGGAPQYDQQGAGGPHNASRGTAEAAVPVGAAAAAGTAVHHHNANAHQWDRDERNVLGGNRQGPGDNATGIDPRGNIAGPTAVGAGGVAGTTAGPGGPTDGYAAGTNNAGRGVPPTNVPGTGPTPTTTANPTVKQGGGTGKIIGGKLQQAGGLLLSSETIRARGLEREAEGVAVKNPTEALRIEQDAQSLRASHRGI